jgi:iron complex transport system substrate-binding protein
MRKSIVIILVIIFILILSCAVHAEEIPDRIISLAPNITEILFALGLNNSIVGVTSFCDHPEEAIKKTKIGGMTNPSLEAVVSLNPDIVVMTIDGNQKEFDEKLRSLGIKTYVFKARRISDLPYEIKELGRALGVQDKAHTLASEIETSMNTFRLSSNQKLKWDKNKVLFIIWPEPLIVAGPCTAIDDVITLLQLKNIASKATIAYPKYSIEEIIRQAPDIIFIGKGHENIKDISKGLLKKIAMVPAVKTGAVCFLSDNLYIIGPRIVEGIEEMAQCIRSKFQP